MSQNPLNPHGLDPSRPAAIQTDAPAGVHDERCERAVRHDLGCNCQTRATLAAVEASGDTAPITMTKFQALGILQHLEFCYGEGLGADADMEPVAFAILDTWPDLLSLVYAGVPEFEAWLAAGGPARETSAPPPQ